MLSGRFLLIAIQQLESISRHHQCGIILALVKNMGNHNILVIVVIKHYIRINEASMVTEHCKLR